MTLQDAADLLQVSKKRLWRAVKAGKLQASQIQIGGKWEYHVANEDLEVYRSTIPLERSTVPMEHSSGPVHCHEERDAERSTNSPSHPPVELYLALVDRLQRAERRTVELELALQQSQRLLCENAESITEREARAQQAEAREEERTAENIRLSAELETSRRQLEDAQRPKGLLSWLGLRKKRTSPVGSADKAV